MTAKEANQLSEKSHTGKINYEYKSVMDKISKAAERGEFSAFINGWISEGVTAKLKADGYNVKSESDRNESFTTVKW